jgi:hypothetical protein
MPAEADQLAIDLDREPAITLATAAAMPILRRDGRKPSLAAVYRWAGQGVGGIRLETVRIGSTLVTSEAAVRRFLSRLNSPTARRRQLRDADRHINHERARRAKAVLAAAGLAG